MIDCDVMDKAKLSLSSIMEGLKGLNNPIYQILIFSQIY